MNGNADHPSSDIVHALISACRQAAPGELWGLVDGRGGRIVPLEVRTEKQGFLWLTDESLLILADAVREPGSGNFWFLFHSHPGGRPVLSTRDLRAMIVAGRPAWDLPLILVGLHPVTSMNVYRWNEAVGAYVSTPGRYDISRTGPMTGLARAP